MMEDIIINKLRILINHFPLMTDCAQKHTIKEANTMLDRYFADGGKFIQTNIDDWIPDSSLMNIKKNGG